MTASELDNEKSKPIKVKGNSASSELPGYCYRCDSFMTDIEDSSTFMLTQSECTHM
ncbi:10577_t:CDS:2 [Entrophospora sp. SA101]|nr:24248_t:CDS:2 [Entrophospora sp. SA101]CAJ0766169.1 10577_t:CDS:2 [Entrophospora sp. SA101]